MKGSSSTGLLEILAGLGLGFLIISWRGAQGQTTTTTTTPTPTTTTTTSTSTTSTSTTSTSSSSTTTTTTRVPTTTTTTTTTPTTTTTTTPTTTTTTTTTTPGNTDPFGLAKLRPTKVGGKEWFCNFTAARTLGNQRDTVDPWMNMSDGDATYTIGGGKMNVTDRGGARIYIIDPAYQREWDENLEITCVFTRVAGTSADYLQIYARTNHAGGMYPGFNEDLAASLCDDRGYGGSMLYDGTWFFEKEDCHHCDQAGSPCGDCSGGEAYPQTGDANGFGGGPVPVNTPIPIKFILHNDPLNTKTTLRMYKGDASGTNWTQITSFTDLGNNFGVGAAACAPGVNPALRLTRALVLPNSVTGKPFISVYFRTEPGTRSVFEKMSIREIDAF